MIYFFTQANLTVESRFGTEMKFLSDLWPEPLCFNFWIINLYCNLWFINHPTKGPIKNLWLCESLRNESVSYRYFGKQYDATVNSAYKNNSWNPAKAYKYTFHPNIQQMWTLFEVKNYFFCFRLGFKNHSGNMTTLSKQRLVQKMLQSF